MRSLIKVLPTADYSPPGGGSKRYVLRYAAGIRRAEEGPAFARPLRRAGTAVASGSAYPELGSLDMRQFVSLSDYSLPAVFAPRASAFAKASARQVRLRQRAEGL